jgi:hypothetical protein
MSEKEQLLSNFDIEKNGTAYPIPEFLKRIDSRFKYICCCRYGLKNLKEHHLRSYYELRQLGIINYDENNEAHENALRALYKNYIRDNESETMIHSDWSNIGFQVDINYIE